MKPFIRLFSMIVLLISTTTYGSLIYTTGDGSAVSSIDRIATFDAISGSLSNYTEDGINIFVNDTHCCFSGGYYVSDGYDAGNVTDSLYRIFAADSAMFFGAEILLQDWGYGTTFNTFVWQTYRSGILTGTNTFTTPSSGTIMGWSDTSGFDELRIGTFLGSKNALWFDDLKIQTTSTSVPEPSTIAIFALGMIGLASRRFKKKS